ncbi:transmembrane protein 208-like [Tubulanus polymorphus]|uniref:transmembrane protein 208-like n=1 Tax=Tubulanus polymorphus TaxID=672921 RepID=UPI003DA51295
MPPKGKQATKGQKQIVEENKSTLNYYLYIITAVNAVYILLQVLLFWDSFTLFYWFLYGLALTVSIGCYQFMAYMAKAKYGASGNLIDGGIDLNMESGMAEHTKDMIILTAVSQSLSLISGYFWLLLLLGPIRGFYLLWVNILSPWFFAEPPPEMDEKKKKKLERKQQKIRYR